MDFGHTEKKKCWPHCVERPVSGPLCESGLYTSRSSGCASHRQHQLHQRRGHEQGVCCLKIKFEKQNEMEG